MKISQKLLIIVCLTMLEVGITVWATFQIAKGGTLHQLNSLHLRNTMEFSELVSQAEAGTGIDEAQLRQALLRVREQPDTATDMVGDLDRLIMSAIGTKAALDLIAKDIVDVEVALLALDGFSEGALGPNELVSDLRKSAEMFHTNSSLFEEPIARTVSFTLKSMVPMIIFISLFNICFITYLSRSISSSIRSLIRLLRSSPRDASGRTILGPRVSGELKELMEVAEGRLRADLMNLETSEELQAIVAERTESLRAATQQAEASLEAKARFLANMSHEIRTPVNGILCASDIVLEDMEESDPRYEFNAIIRDSTESLLRILNDVLDISKMESGQLAIESIRFNLKETVEQLAALMALEAKKKGLEFECTFELCPSCEYVKGDPTRVRQILINLLSNALKFTDKGAVRVHVAVAPCDAGLPAMVAVVTDTGIGMSEEQLSTLWDRFEQADDSTTRKYGGTGLGMSLSLELARLMNGDLSATSELGSGSEFRLALPFDRCAAPEHSKEAVAHRKGSGRDYGGARVLLVEDNLVNQKVATRILARMGLDVTVAENGAKALELATDDIALVLMDIQMPVMDGLEATTELIERGWTKPVIALSANVFPEDLQRYAEVGMSGFLPKPLQVAVLKELLDEHLQCTRQKAA